MGEGQPSHSSSEPPGSTIPALEVTAYSRAREELESSKDDMELTKAKLKKLEEDLDGARQKNLALQNQITATANCDKTEELETKIKSMEEQLKATTEERDKLTKNHRRNGDRTRRGD
ncbi:hypothetical protein GWK47_017747 [Chionoecetes opilio]|uniref:Uncharacterized protein n=1 Tax=Chionoecetes opilio TaxID=41210 RepID=A0A8J4XTK9_CHIOP|nr:hypothetical protein GWK47_017747 [Chionoecetes opilio]KAG0712752.1 hypothetical protein GWK47_017747 [Chionoecetes opilio]KAG0712754.1 hypothetical protein GWK47_017747 [Chionoecetes opilio]KAG0712755.1 hypothetical protein GWK47_017747 [Chionoecetes opilio]KAG0712756.1 hypothetical protein GWK47_017747 [Chionoecetes opilio]